MARTSLATMLEKAYNAAHAAMEIEKGKNNVMTNQNNTSNETKTKDLLKKGKEKQSQDRKERKNNPKVVIVGAGLAGLTCAYRLKQEGIDATVYEASNRAGGRCWTRRGEFKECQIVERGGEIIDTDHIEIQELARELGLVLDDLIEAEPANTETFYYFNGGPYTVEEATTDFLEIYPRLQEDLDEVGEYTLYNHYTKRGFQLDHMSIIDYINEIVPGGIRSRFGELLAVAYTVESGAEAYMQSALNLLYLLGSAPRGSLEILGESDGRFRIRDGNDKLTTILAEKLSGQIEFNAELIKIEQYRENRIRLIFRNQQRMWEVLADKVIITIPFSILRRLDYRKAGFRRLKHIAIQELGMGVNTKLHVQFFNRYWNELGNNGETYTDTGYQGTDEVSRAQPGKSGILVNYTGGRTAARQFATTDKQLEAITLDFLRNIEPVLPGGIKNWNSISKIDHWLSDPWTRGSYSYFKVGQYTKFAGIEGEREGNIFFAGEHTSIDYQGYLNGAVESGERAAQEVMDDL
ncbi:flavin monoamine oxidase family protein [Ureibacillus manganicus]|uniref:Monoamine oxidase n=1 Tax=Ureibacillus manganicus DSM 26584 TaxID=1384049 RepID=A0A0A3I6K3_9BACL|nr:NAD(P)/FAD-dependent oxidoreductase [Ureibacillus manganicus]KGR79155.1 monoamine oxidase [Ureibacillus manganicus DSM 26584]